MQRILRRIQSYLQPRRVVALPLLGQMAGLVLMSATMPLQTSVLAADTPTASVPLVLTTDSVHLMVSLPERTTLKVTVVESKAQEKERIEREERAKALVKKKRSVVITAVAIAGPTDVSFETKRALAQKAAAAYGIDWKILEAVWQIESGKRWVTDVKSYAGAQGPMQFMPGTWRGYAVDGNGDGVASVYHAEDAVFAGARYLAANGGATDVNRALFAYNHAQWYVDKVKALAASI